MQTTPEPKVIELTGTYSALEHIGDREIIEGVSDGQPYRITLRPPHENPKHTQK